MLFLWAICMTALIFMWVFFLPIFIVGFLVAIPFFTIALPISLAISAAIYLSYDQIKESSLRDIISSAPFEVWFQNIDINLDLTKNHLICCHPHGILCTAAVMGIHFKPKSKTLIAVAPIVFMVPIIGWIAKHLGAIPATYDAIIGGLKHTSVILLPGGVPEIICVEKEVHYTDRVGFLRCAKRAGVTIYAIVNEKKYYDLVPMPLYNLRLHIAKTYNIPIVFPWILGWYGTWLPKRFPIQPRWFEFQVYGEPKDLREEYYAKIRRSQ